ncbi:hypothetical protein FRC03_010341 [Tulasnella sp. 419]|nr:hypothetical protein FRC02_000822 [Tulasnella sp. 418]KAG8957247.1 hypothetical protein FRC03_010341 [Tulasnella sp. 419]
MSTSDFDPNTAENLQEIEKQWAVKTVEQAQVYWNLITKYPPKTLKLTKIDDEIYEDFSQSFPEYIQDPSRLTKLDEDQMKDKQGKERWRNFINRYEKKVKDFNFGTLVRNNSADEYGQFNAMFVTRMQFYAIEIARNRLGLNDEIYEKAKAEAEAEANKASS